MYNPLLDTFIAVADCGSFNKAAEMLYISPTAVMKQMNSLEEHLKLTLIKRAQIGVTLTEVGVQIYKDAKFMVDYSQKSILSARAIETTSETTFCVGTSLLNPAKPFMDIWYKVNQNFPDYKLHLVPFEDNCNGILSEIGKLGKKFDFLIGVCDSKVWLSLCNFLPLGRYKKMVAVRREHPLATKDRLKISDLYGYTLMMVKRGDSGVNDFLRNDLEKCHPQIKIEDTQPFYDLSVFNRCAETDKVLLTIECWQDVHPALVTIPVKWDYSIPYGILYAKDAPTDVLSFIEISKQYT
ncbi:LysR family transcriptional regulator [Butyricicoccus sp. Marseille-Q5471]|uniref:LysR family transcriptional regulator n=1 Tax=Butyricicoccus sp. Marseille-Q5471 TaxID=3039493 RepID=UPI0024BC281E|nr:LysR family transcriptional regulator [Butyricicoccus sp. Marseille-Q5471]